MLGSQTDFIILYKNILGAICNGHFRFVPFHKNDSILFRYKYKVKNKYFKTAQFRNWFRIYWWLDYISNHQWSWTESRWCWQADFLGGWDLPAAAALSPALQFVWLLSTSRFFLNAHFLKKKVPNRMLKKNSLQTFLWKFQFHIFSIYKFDFVFE